MIIDVDRHGEFRLPDEFVDGYRSRPAPWGFGALSWVTYRRTYSRNGERWHETCRRVIEGTFTVQRAHCLASGRPWDEGKALALAREAYERMWCFKWTPPGRGLWIMGTRFMYERGGAALNNCGFVSTAGIGADYAAPFLWMLRMSMLGVGVGFDTRGRGKATVVRPATCREPHVIGDSREGWAEALGRLLGAYVGRGALPSEWDYSQIRPRGKRLESFGGHASGPVPLSRMLEGLDDLYRACEGKVVDSRLLVDTMNIIGRCVVAGGIRRSAQIAIGDPDDIQFLDLKTDAGKVAEYRWVSNNSVFARRGMDYSDIAARTCRNGEPGYFWLENARARGRMGDEPDWADEAAQGSNPCVEQTLWDRELCCLVETYPAHHETAEDYCRTLRLAYLYAKTVTLVPTADPTTNAVMERNRRIGCSMTGIVQAINRFGRSRFLALCDDAYRYIRQLDAEYSGWLGVPRSIKTTSVKPSGTVSILAGATPGVHWDHAPYYIRRVRVRDDHPLVDMCGRAGYTVEADHYADSTSVVSFPVHVENAGRRKSEVPLREKVELAAQMQHHWSDNQVSCTADFNPDTEVADVPRLLSDYEDRLKAIVFLPSETHGYEQPPYEEISRAEYERMLSAIGPLRGDLDHEESLEARFCEGDVCEPL